MKGIFKIGLVGMGVSFALFLTISRGATNCSDAEDYPKTIIKPKVDPLNLISMKDFSFFIKRITKRLHFSLAVENVARHKLEYQYKICCDNKEKDLKFYAILHFKKMKVKKDVSVGMLKGKKVKSFKSMINFINNELAVVNKINKDEMTEEEIKNAEKIINVIQDYMSNFSAKAISVTAVYDALFYDPHKEEDGCQTDVISEAFLGTELYKLTANVGSWEGTAIDLSKIYLNLFKMNLSFERKGEIVNHEAVYTETLKSEVFSEYRFGDYKLTRINWITPNTVLTKTIKTPYYRNNSYEGTHQFH